MSDMKSFGGSVDTLAGRRTFKVIKVADICATSQVINSQSVYGLIPAKQNAFLYHTYNLNYYQLLHSRPFVHYFFISRLTYFSLSPLQAYHINWCLLLYRKHHLCQLWIENYRLIEQT